MTSYKVTSSACSVYLRDGSVTLLYREGRLPAVGDMAEGEAERLLEGGFVVVVEQEASGDAAPAGNAGVEKWAAYATGLGLEVPEGASRDDIKALVAASQE
jgi:hypothetical protein